MSGLSLAGIEKRFGESRVVRGLDLDLSRGEIVSLLGPSGCGKTTALRMVAGLERPDAGRIQIGERVVYGPDVDRPPEARGIGMVFQSYAVWPHKNVLENVAYPLRLAKAQDATEKAERALEMVKLTGLGQRFPNALSGGQQQRVALARALVAQPELLLFDEPLSNLDQKLREEMRHEIRRLVKQIGITALYVTHDQGEAFAVSDRVAVMLEGQIAQIGVPCVLYDEPKDLAVARFVGRLSVLTGVSRGADGRAAIGGVSLPAVFCAGWDGPGGALLGVRPEDVRIAAAGGAGLAAKVVRATYLGDKIELELETAHGALRADAGTADGAGLVEGASVSVNLERGRVYGQP